jgi:hypothetical protein
LENRRVCSGFRSFCIEILDLQRAFRLVRSAIKRHRSVRRKVLSIGGLSSSIVSNSRSRAFVGQRTKSINTLHFDSILRTQASSWESSASTAKVRHVRQQGAGINTHPEQKSLQKYHEVHHQADIAHQAPQSQDLLPGVIPAEAM